MNIGLLSVVVIVIVELITAYGLNLDCRLGNGMFLKDGGHSGSLYSSTSELCRHNFCISLCDF